MGELIRQVNWSDTPLGAPGQWPQPLQTMVSVLLNARFPMFLWWGPDLIHFYNDAYRPSLGDFGKHPAAVGQRGEDCWPEIWTTIKPLIDQVLGGGKATWQEDQLVPIQRNGRLEDVYWTFSYSPVPDETGRPGGVLVTCTETTGQVQARQTLLRSEERFRNLIMYSPVAFALFRGPQFIIELANDRVLEYWGRTRDEVLNKPLFEALPEASGQGFETLLTGVYTTGERVMAKELTVALERNGKVEQTYIDFVYEPYREPDPNAGNITGVTVVCVEITEQVMARRALQDEKNRLNTILNELPIGVVMTNATGELIYGNRQVEQIFRHPFGESRDIEAYTNWPLFDPTTGEPFPFEAMPMVRTLLHGETVTGVEIKLRRGDDTWGYANVNTVPIYDSTGQLQGGVGTFVDITGQKQGEETLRQSEEQLQIVQSSITDHAIITTDTQGIITGWNAGAQEIFGFTAPEAIGQPIGLIFTPEDRVAGVPDAEMMTARQQGRAACERYQLRKDGSRFYGFGVLSLLNRADGQLLGYVKVARDMSVRQQMEQALREADQRKDEFLATLAHELRNPLAPIRNTLQILNLTAAADETVAPAVAMMARQVDHLVHLVDDLLDVSRISQGKLRLRLERIELGEVVRQAVAASGPLYEAAGRELTVALPFGPIHLSGDATRLAQIVTNLLNNAAKFTHEGGHVWLSVERAGGESDGRMALLRVRDDGIGISPDQLESIFELFNQADNTLERSRSGLGLGLTLVRQLAELHGGRVEAYSGGIDQGSEFRVYLPMLAELPKAQSAPDKVPAPTTAGRQILVIDDNRDAATTLAMLLKLKGGHKTHTRFSGQDGIAAAESLRPEVILLDIGMPGLNGYETCRLIREQPWGQSMMLIALTGFGQEDDKRLSREAGFDAYLVKPVDVAALNQLLVPLPANPKP